MPSLALASVVYFSYYYFWMFAVLIGLLYIYKVINLPYPSVNIVSEVFIYIFLSVIEVIRIFMGRKGNLTDAWSPLLASLLMTLPSILGVLYFLLWQTYVLKLEVILVIIQLTFESLTFLLGLFRLITLIYYK